MKIIIANCTMDKSKIPSEMKYQIIIEPLYYLPVQLRVLNLNMIKNTSPILIALPAHLPYIHQKS